MPVYLKISKRRIKCDKLFYLVKSGRYLTYSIYICDQADTCNACTNAYKGKSGTFDISI